MENPMKNKSIIFNSKSFGKHLKQREAKLILKYSKPFHQDAVKKGKTYKATLDEI